MSNNKHNNTTTILSAIASRQCAHTSTLVEASGLSRNAVLTACRTLARRGFVCKVDADCEWEGCGMGDKQRTNGRYSDAQWQAGFEVGPADWYTDLDVIAGLIAQKGDGHSIIQKAGLGI